MNVRRIVFWLMVLFLGVGCAQTIAFRSTPEAAAALGEAKVSKDRNNNTEIEIKVNHLAPSQNLSPAKAAYVVWAQAPQGRIINLGQMVVGNDRSGKFTGVTALHQFRLLITAEDLPAVSTPSQQVVLSTEVFTVER